MTERTPHTLDELHDRIYEMQAINNLVHICVANACMERFGKNVTYACEVSNRIADEAKELAMKLHDEGKAATDAPKKKSIISIEEAQSGKFNPSASTKDASKGS